MTQSHNIHHDGHPGEQLFHSGLESLANSWAYLTGLFSSWNSNDGSNHENKHIKSTNSERSDHDNAFPHNKNSQQNTISGNHGHTDPKNVSQHETRTHKMLPIGALKQIDISYVSLYNEIWKDARQIVNQVKGDIPIPLRKITHEDLRNENTRNAVIHLIFEVVLQLLDQNKHKKKEVHHSNSANAVQLTLFYKLLQLTDQSTNLNHLQNVFKNPLESAIEVDEMTFAIQLMQQKIIELGKKKLLDDILEKAKRLAREKER